MPTFYNPSNGVSKLRVDAVASALVTYAGIVMTEGHIAQGNTGWRAYQKRLSTANTIIKSETERFKLAESAILLIFDRDYPTVNNYDSATNQDFYRGCVEGFGAGINVFDADATNVANGFANVGQLGNSIFNVIATISEFDRTTA